MIGFLTSVTPVLIVLFLLAIVALKSTRRIGPAEVGLVTKRWSGGRLSNDSPVALKGEAGYQADLLMPGIRWKIWPLYSVENHPWVQVPAGEIGVVIAQVGNPTPIGAKSAVYKPEFGNFTDLRSFIQNGGQKGVQRPVLSPGSIVPIHPVGFLVITKNEVFGEPISDLIPMDKHGDLGPQSFGLTPDQLDLVRIGPQERQANKDGKESKTVDTIGIVTTFEGDPLDSSDIASRLDGFKDMSEMEKNGKKNAELIEVLLGNKNAKHNNYQDFQAFLDHGGRIGLQHDPLLYGAYALNPFLVKVEIVPMLVVEQGQVAVVKAYVGLPTEDTSGSEFKFGTLVRPGHRGIWEEPLRTGKYPVNPHCYQVEIVPTAILTLNWAEAVSQAHNLDRNLQQIVAKSSEGFVFKIDLQVQIHVADTKAPRVISMVGTMYNLVNEVLQAAVGNHFRDKMQSMPAVKFIETRQAVQEEATAHISKHLSQYEVETRGVYIQDVILPEELVKVLTEREIANQEIQTFKKQTEAQTERITVENAKGLADQQADLAKSKVGIAIKTNNADARKAEADGESTYIREIGTAKGAEVESVGLAHAKSYEKQVEALGQVPTAIVNAVRELAQSKNPYMPNVLVAGANGHGTVDGLMGVITNLLNNPDIQKKITGGSASTPAEPAAK